MTMQPVNKKSAHKLNEGGAITAFQNKLTFDGTVTLIHNQTLSGKAIHAIEARLHIHGTILVANNTAIESGGGAYVYQSEVICQQRGKFSLVPRPYSQLFQCCSYNVQCATCNIEKAGNKAWKRG